MNDLSPSAMRDKLRRMKIPVPAELDARADAHMLKLHRARQEKRQAERDALTKVRAKELAAATLEIINRLPQGRAPAPMLRALKMKLQASVRQFLADRCSQRRPANPRRGAA